MRKNKEKEETKEKQEEVEEEEEEEKKNINDEEELEEVEEEKGGAGPARDFPLEVNQTRGKQVPESTNGNNKSPLRRSCKGEGECSQATPFSSLSPSPSTPFPFLPVLFESFNFKGENRLVCVEKKVSKIQYGL